MTFFVLIVALMWQAPADAKIFQSSAIVATEQGPVRGVSKSSGTKVFLGIPYAEPPVGRQRWRAPQKPKAREGFYDATEPGEICMQLSLLTKRVIGSEDCLYLNVWVPESANNRKLPVMFWIHGGAFILGDGIQKVGLVSMYDGARLAEAGEVIVVSINYRLGPLGFMANSQLARENKNGSAGNYGILDQIAALKWVQKNIENFGGDPDRVTIFGESAGGASVLTLLASPLAKGLFHGAISQSGPVLEQTMEAASIQGERVISKYGDSRGRMTMEQLREVPADRIVRDFPLDLGASGKGPATHYTPVIDGYVLERPILETLERGEGARVPLMIGSNRDEMTVLSPVFLHDLPKPFTDEHYERLVEDLHGEEAAKEILDNYNADTHGSNKRALLDLFADGKFHSPAQQVAGAMEKYSPRSTYVYVFSQEVNFFGAGHGTEIPYIFQNPSLLHMFSHKLFRPLTSLAKYSDQVELSEQMMKFWTRFAHNGNPNGPKGANELYWPDSSKGKIMRFHSADSKVIDSFKKEQVKFWKGLNCDNLLAVTRK